MTDVSTVAPEAKTKRVRASKAAPAPTTKAAKPAKVLKKPVAEKPAKPSVPKHAITMKNYDGASGVANINVTKTAIDPAKFGSLPGAAMTDRDRKALRALRENFERKNFTRANLDAGILRRLGERGFVSHVSGSPVAPDALYKLTPAAFGKEVMVA